MRVRHAASSTVFVALAAAGPLAAYPLQAQRLASGVSIGAAEEGPAGPSAEATQAAPIAPDLLDGLRFRNIGPASMSGRVVDLAVVERDVDVFYVATATGGVWKTTNGGVTLTPVFERQAVHSVGAVAVHQRDTSIVWVGTGERASRQSSSWGDGVYKSTDGGRTWRNMGLPDSYHIGRIVLHPDDPDLVYVAAMGHLWGPNEERGLYRSTDGGGSWERILHVDENTGSVDVAMDPSRPEILYATTYQRRRRPWGFHGGGPGSGLWRSTDRGDTWTELSHEGGLPEGEYGRIGISIFRSDPRIVYVSVEQGERYNASTAYEHRRAGIFRSEDRGETWEHMSDWNPRPMYASQILVDPNDDQRVYMVNTYSWSDDGGRTFTVPRQSLHGDDRLVWVNPQDSDHVMKADDGGLGISHDRGVTWLFISDLPVSQYYRIAFDLRDPYWLYGGLQDNGSWGGPNATYRSEGVLNSDWIRYGGGDGFLNIVDTTDNRTLYTESQYLGLSRVDMVTGERTTIRPGDSIGAISARRNWATWPDPDAPDQPLGNAMAPANWDGPFLLSPHDPHTIYAGTHVLWRSSDRGDHWESLGDLTTGVARQTLRVMGELPDSQTLSLDDGIPYYPTLTAIAESPLQRGLLYVGTDDGQLHVSRDDGASFTEVSARLAGLPDDAWINDIEASRHVEGRVYVSANNYRNDDYANYLYRSDDYGESWVTVAGDLPPERVVRVLREDPRNTDVLYLGTELGLFYSANNGAAWSPVNSGLPTVAVNDLRVHTRDNDLILGTHGRGIWILDNVNALQELTPEVRASPSHLFTLQSAYQIRYRSELPHTGDVFYHGENPPAGATIDYWLGQEGGEPRVSIHDRAGERVAWIESTSRRGLNRVVWSLRHSEPDQGEEPAEPQQPGARRRDGGDRGPTGPLVVPGLYTVRLTLGDRVLERPLEVREDPRIDVSQEVRRAWTLRLLELGALRREAREASRQARGLIERMDEGALDVPVALAREIRDLDRALDELEGRLGRLIGEVEDVVGPLTGDQESEAAYYERMVETLSAELRAVVTRTGP